MKRPFGHHENRMKFYVIFALILASFTTVFAIDRVEEPADLKGINTATKAYCSIMYISVYTILAVTSLTYAYNINTRLGVSTSLRKRIICRHGWQTATFILAWAPYLACTYYILYLMEFEGRSRSDGTLPLDDQDVQTIRNWITLFNAFSVSVGIVISLITIFEPSFLNIISSAYC